MLYRIEGTGVKIAGVTPSAPSEDARVPRWLQHVFEDADRAVFAADREQTDPTVFLLPANQSLTVLSFYDAVATLWRTLQIPGHPARFKAWVVSARLRAHLAKLVAPGAGTLLLAEAKRRTVPPAFLDTAQEWIATCDAVPLEQQLEQLERVVTSPEEAALFEVAVHEAWTAHNFAAMSELLEEQRRQQPGFYLHALDSRNRRWLAGLMRLIGESASAKRALNTLIVVEALHLCGPQGLVALLTNEGQKLTQLL